MTGFVFVLKGADYKSELLDGMEQTKGETYYCKYKRLDRFENDRLMFRKGKQFYLLDGAVFNKKEIMKKYKCCHWDDAFFHLVQEDQDGFMNKLRGAFCGIVYDEASNILRAYTNFCGDKAVFYYTDGDVCIITSHMLLMNEALVHYKKEDIRPDIQGCYEMLITGSLLHGNTIIKNVRRIMGGKALVFKHGTAKEIRYHIFKNVPEWNLTLDECIDKADELFRNAVKSICEKNKEYGYKMEADLSGGLDSRLVTWVANDLGYKNIINVCWCVKGGIDHLISKKIAKDLGNEYYFYSLDSGWFLMDVDEILSITGGQVLYFISTGANKAFQKIDISNIGMAITGLLGELHNAYWTEGDCHTKPDYIHNRDSLTLRLKYPSDYCKEYENYEQMNLYEFSGLLYLSSVFSRQDRVEVCSPFIDKDFLEFAYRIPLKWRKDYFFTMSWMCKKYPQAAKYVWQHEMKPVDSVFYNKFYLPKFVWGGGKTYAESLQQSMQNA